MVASTTERNARATHQDVHDAPAYLVAEIINGTLHTQPPAGGAPCVSKHGARRRPSESLSVWLRRAKRVVGPLRAGAAPRRGSSGAGLDGLAPRADAGLSRHRVFHARSGLDVRGTLPVNPQARPSRETPPYALAGVGHLWLVDPTDRTLEAFELREGEWVLIATAKDDEPVSNRPFDAITFSLADLWP